MKCRRERGDGRRVDLGQPVVELQQFQYSFKISRFILTKEDIFSTEKLYFILIFPKMTNPLHIDRFFESEAVDVAVLVEFVRNEVHEVRAAMSQWSKLNLNSFKAELENQFHLGDEIVKFDDSGTLLMISCKFWKFIKKSRIIAKNRDN